MTDALRLAHVAVNFPLRDSILTYLASDFQPGDLVQIPLGRRREKGLVLSVHESLETPSHPLKPIDSRLSDSLHVSEEHIQLFQWMSHYYHYGLGPLVFDILPEMMKRPRPLSSVAGLGLPLDWTLTETQSSIAESIRATLTHGFSRHFLHGVTGSGKTAVYLELIRDTLQRGQSVLFLLPEINLTPQFTKTFETYLSAPIYSYHSDVSASDKFGLWKLLQSDDSPKFILGVRSAVFLPIKKLGLIIVDEEHDGSFKQEDRCPYHARDVAIKRASLLSIPIVLGSATPAVETYYNFKEKWPTTRYELRERVGDSTLPQIDLVEISREEKPKIDDSTWPFETRSIEAIAEALARHEQVLVFVNRLGFANFLQCRGCGHRFLCLNCSTALRYFKNKNQLSCQHCTFTVPIPDICPKCGCMSILQKGFGTERVHEVMARLFPSHRIERFDRDEIRTMTQLKERLDDFHSGNVDILVGTQMLSKGHNFKKVNLVVILGIDSQLNFPDFRSNEKVYQLLSQVAGRAGRYGKDGRVLIQTMNAEHSLFKHIQDHSFDLFYKEELLLRQACDCPPYSRIAILYVHSRFQERAVQESMAIKQLIESISIKHFPSVTVLGPRPNSIEKRVGEYTWNIMLKSSDANALHQLITSFDLNYKAPSGVATKLDIDPGTIL